jgi:O-glycosyl hydrolase
MKNTFLHQRKHSSFNYSHTLLIALLFFNTAFCQNTAITIDTNKRYQTIEGFGGFNTLSIWNNAPNEKKYDLIVNDLGYPSCASSFRLLSTHQRQRL